MRQILDTRFCTFCGKFGKMTESDSNKQEMRNADPNIGLYYENPQHEPAPNHNGIKSLVRNLIRGSEFTTSIATQRKVNFSAIDYLAERIKPRILCRIDDDASKKNPNPSPKSTSCDTGHLDGKNTLYSNSASQSIPFNHCDRGDCKVISVQFDEDRPLEDDTTTENLKKDGVNNLDSSSEESCYSSSSFVSEESDD